MNAVKLIPMLALALLAGCASVPQQPPEPLPQPELREPPRANNGSIFQAGRGVRLFEDRTARRVGDIITVVLEESTDASKDSSTTVAKDQSIGLGVPEVFGRAMTVNGNPLSANVEAGRNFGGSGSADQSNALSGNLTAIVTDVMANGNLIIEGQKKLTLNQGDEYITVSGIIRPDDVNPDNTVSSTRVANARIGYTGNGALADANTMGWIARVFNSGLWPF
ncbi:flagellar basal body L-ring protein FlgH [Alkalilimnicola sp. S0819]|uniref:flagellar basal body L-ring protein FlgH n=1 Tax=Alkalilimnicola sp. S0819 TaxID=2613922 RepID=UPI001261C1B2|nr:flagellar basal body L-ring protein FlgH [Alkalilimnicola sp. S0819]KAB7627195.1 flagellar basal body L-ring protein FlgH [Alkalilimnicola sp. S0819]MPQ15908.1 flagellar basal body L-ring protein FlgH [Alkalilimnicola sp. S0819]